jgi:hypothetical protein
MESISISSKRIGITGTLCPIRMIGKAVMFVKEDAENIDTAECLGSLCAWWEECSNECSIKTIIDSIDYNGEIIAKEVEDLAVHAFEPNSDEAAIKSPRFGVGTMVKSTKQHEHLLKANGSEKTPVHGTIVECRCADGRGIEYAAVKDTNTGKICTMNATWLECAE